MKGKYAAQAANREFRRGKAIIAEKTAQIADLTAQVAQLQQQLTDERRQRNSLIVNRADDVSAKQIELLHADMAAERAAYTEEKRFIADAFVGWFHDRAVVPDFWAGEVLPILIPDHMERGKYLLANFGDEDFDNRYDRRRSAILYERALRTKRERTGSQQKGRALAKGKRYTNTVAAWNTETTAARKQENSNEQEA